MMENKPLSREKLRDKLQKLFEVAQEKSGCQSVVEAAKKLYNKQNNNEQFLNEFLHVLKYCLLFPDKAAAEKTLLFVAKFAASLYSVKALQHDDDESVEDLEHPFLTGLLNFIFQTHSAVSVDARLRCTQLINHILSAMPDDSWLPVSIWNGLAEVTRNRLQDRNSGVRVAAVLVARKLQEPKDPKCDIVKLLSFHMTDPAPAVRRSVIASIALTRHTIGDVIARTLDVNDNVRRNAFAALAKVRFQNLKITQRISLLERGLRDRVDRVRQCVETVLIAQWLDHVENNIWTLLEGLDVVNCPEIVGQALYPIIKIMTVEKVIEALKLNPETHLIPLEHLSPESALAWKILVIHASKEKLDDVLDEILPNISAFCRLLQSWYPLDQVEPDPTEDEWLNVKRKHVMIHLLELAVNFDLSDELGRKNLRSQIITMLINPIINDSLVEKLIELLFVVVPNVDNVLMTLMEAISEIREPLTQVVVEQPMELIKQTQVTVCGHKLALNDLREKEYEAASAKNYTEAAKLQSEIKELEEKIESLTVPVPAVLSEVREEKTDAETVCKCLKIMVKMIPCSQIKGLTPGLKCLREDFLASCLASEDLMTQSLAIQVLAQFCVLDKELAQENLLKFLLMLSEEGEEEINIPALKAVFDILQINGTQCFNKLASNLTPTKCAKVDVDDINLSQITESELSIPAEKCIDALKELMNSTTNEGMKLVAFEGFCKLLLCNVIYSPTLLKNIIIKGFTPIRGNETEDRIRQLFMVFFPLFVRKTRRSQEMIEAAFIPVLRSINDAPLGSPEGDINPRDVTLFLIDATRPGINQFTNQTVHVHDNLALAICHEILKDIASYEDLGLDQNYLKALQQFQISVDDVALMEELLILSEKIQKRTMDPASIRLIKQFKLKLQTAGSVSSIQNTLENTPLDQNQTETQTTLSNKQPLETVNESLEISSFEDEDKTVTKHGNVVPESPEKSEESE